MAGEAVKKVQERRLIGGEIAVIHRETGADSVLFDDGTSFQQKLNSGELKGEPGKDGVIGKDGAPGVPGKDGVSPTVSVSRSGSVTTLTITDASGEKTADIHDGATGAVGPVGPNQVSASTDSDISGLLKGSGGKVTAAAAGTDYVTPSGSITGNAGTSDRLKTARRINITGGAVGSASFDGSEDITINVTVTAKAVWG